MALGLNFIARWRKFRCPSFFISLPVGVNFVARRYMYPLPVVFYFVARRYVAPLPSVFYFVARRFFTRCPSFFMPMGVKIYAYGRRHFRPF